jgi:hypothetical protein
MGSLDILLEREKLQYERYVFSTRGPISVSFTIRPELLQQRAYAEELRKKYLAARAQQNREYRARKKLAAGQDQHESS